METIKILDALKQVIKSPETWMSEWEWNTASEMGIEINTDEFKKGDYRLTMYPIESWYCTDTHVGSWALYFDKEPVAYVTQLSRKEHESYHWVSNEAYSKVRAYLLTLEVKEPCHIVLLAEEMTIDRFFSISFVSQLLFDSAFLDGRSVKIIDRNVDAGEYLKKRVKIALVETGEEKIVNVADLAFPIAVNLEGK